MEKLRLREAGSESWEVAEPEVKNSRMASVSCSAQRATLALGRRALSPVILF